jgi:hypothetical protein
MRSLKNLIETNAVSAIEKVILSFSDQEKDCTFVLIDEVEYPKELIALEIEKE